MRPFFFLPETLMISHSDTRFGSSAWATESDIERAGLMSGEGMPFGYFNGRLLRYSGDSPKCLIAGSGSGKFTSVLTLPLLDKHSDQNICMLDPKNEGWSVTSHALAAKGIFAYNWNPMQMNGAPQHCINPLEHLTHNSPSLFADTSVLCEALLPHSGGGTAKFFELSARSTLTSLIVHFVYTHGCINFGDVFHLVNMITGPVGPWADYLEAMQASHDPYVQAQGHAITQEALDAPKQWVAIVSELKANLNWLNDKRVRTSLSGQDMPLEKMIRGSQKFRLHLGIPGDLIEFFAPVLRVIFTTLMTLKGRAPGASPILFIADESGLLSTFDALTRMMTFGRSAGLQAFPVFQDIGQIKKAYGPSGVQTYLGNSALQFWFGIRDFESAKYLSDAIGATSYAYHDRAQQSDSAHRQYQEVQSYLAGGDPIAASQNYSFYGEGAARESRVRRMLITPDEIMALPNDKMIVMMPGHPPIMATRIPYFENPDLAGRYVPNPYHPPMDRVQIHTGKRTEWRKVRNTPVPQKYAHFPQYRNGIMQEIEGYPL